jgi:hypothetical protein
MPQLCNFLLVRQNNIAGGGIVNSLNQNQAPISHSRLGIASFVIANVFGGAFFAVALLMTIFKSSLPDWRSYPASIMLLGSLMLLCFLACLIGVVLGIVALRERNRKKTLVIIGLIVNGLVALLVLTMIIMMNLLGSIVENFILACAYTLPAMAIGFAVLYFTYIRKAKFTWRQILQGLLLHGASLLSLFYYLEKNPLALVT